MFALAPHASEDAISEVVSRTARTFLTASPDEVRAMATAALEHALTHGMSEASAKEYAVTSTLVVVGGHPLSGRVRACA